MTSSEQAAPKAVLGTTDVVAIVVGLVIGAGIFRFPSLVAGAAADETVFYALWVAGGVVSLVGALCYAELATAYPNAGGDYYFLQRAFGRPLSFLFAWARIAVITTGAIALLGYTFGDYASTIAPLGPRSSAIYAALAVVVLTGVNLLGIRETKGTQNTLTVLLVLGLLAVIVTGILLVAPAAPAPAPAEPKPWAAGVPFAMLFILFTYSGWNEAAYVSAELKERRSMVIAMVLGLGLITVLYLAINYAYVRGLGLQGVAKSETVAADLMKVRFGDIGANLISAVVCLAALTSINATIIAGARSNYALGRDWAAFRWLGRWDERTDAPRNSLYLQGAVALVLVVAGAFTDQVKTMIEYTSPVFWFFFMMVGIALFVLRSRDRATPRPFKVPLYPLTPVVFVLTCAYLLYSSLAYVKGGAWAGVAVLAVGALLLVPNLRRAPQPGRP